jgi:uncharacterized membrane protein YcaP (DUF421 family)
MKRTRVAWSVRKLRATRNTHLDGIGDWLQIALGLGVEGNELSALQMGARAIVVYAVTLIIVRLGKKRFMGRATAFDVIMGVVLGSVVSRAITGNSPLVPTLAAAAVLVFMHWGLSYLAMSGHVFGGLIKGQARILVRDGQIEWEHMRDEHMTEHDLWEDLRGKGISKLSQIAEARLERSGELSVIRADRGFDSLPT